MMIDVHIADGRTVFRLKSRGQLIDLIKRDLSELDESRAIACWVRWHPGDDFVPCKIMSMRGHSVAFTRMIELDERQAFDLAFPPPTER